MRRKLLPVFFLGVLIIAIAYPDSPPDKTRIIVAGSSCMGRLMGALAEEYRDPESYVEVQLGGTQLGLQHLREGVIDLASSSRNLTEKEKGIIAIPVAIDAIAIIVHRENQITSLTLDQLAGIYARGADRLVRGGGSAGANCSHWAGIRIGTRAAFESGIGMLHRARHGQEIAETGLVRSVVAQTKGAIGYLSQDYVDDSVRAVAVEGVLPTEQTVRNGSYPLVHPFLLCCRESEDREAVRRFLNFVTGEGQTLIRQLGVITAEKGNMS